MYKESSKTVLNSIINNARTGQITIPVTIRTEKEISPPLGFGLKAIRPGEKASSTWPLLIFHNTVQYTVVSRIQGSVVSYGSPAIVKESDIKNNGLMALRPLFESFTNFAIIENNLWSLSRYLEENQLQFSHLVIS